MCTQKPPHDYSQQLYDKYRESFEEYIVSTVSSAIIWIWYGYLHVWLYLNFFLVHYLVISGLLILGHSWLNNQNHA